MFNAAYLSQNGRVSALYLLDLMQSDTLFFRSDEIVFENGRRRIRGMQLDAARAEKLPEVSDDIERFSAAVADWTAYAEENSGVYLDAESFSKKAREIAGSEPLTAIELMNFLCRNFVKLSRSGELFIAAADEDVKAAFPTLGSMLRRLIRAALAYDGSPAQQVNVIVATGGSDIAARLVLRRRLVAAAANAEKDSFSCEALAESLGESCEKTREALRRLCELGVFEEKGERFCLDYDSREAAILLAESDAAREARKNREPIRAAFLSRAVSRYERVKNAAADCAAALERDRQDAEETNAQLAQTQAQSEESGRRAAKKSSAASQAGTAFLFVFGALFFCVAAYFFFVPDAPQILSFSRVSVAAIAMGAGAVFVLIGFLRLIAAARAKRRAQALREQAASLADALSRIESDIAQKKRESGVYAAYLVLARAIAQDMQRGDFRGVDLAEKLVPGEVFAVLSDDRAPAVRAQIVTTLSHCGTATENELAFLTGAGHERVRRALYEMIAAGQIVLWQEDGARKYCLCQSL